MKMYLPRTTLVTGVIIFIIAAGQFVQCKSTKADKRNTVDMTGDPYDFDDDIKRNADDLFEKGRAVFRFESFGDEVFWSDKLQLHRAIADEKHGGFGKGLSPKEALAAGLKVDLAILP